MGTIVAHPDVSDAIRKVHDFLTVGAAAPLQEAGAAALALPQDYYEAMAIDYGKKRDRMLEILDASGVPYHKPAGAYYVMCEIDKFGFEDDVAFCRHLCEHVGVAAIPPSAFYHDPADGRALVRFAFCKDEVTLREAVKRLSKLSS